MSFQLSEPWRKTLAGIFQNLSAAWFGVSFLTPAFFSQSSWPLVLTGNLFLGIFYLLLAVRFEEMAKL